MPLICLVRSQPDWPAFIVAGEFQGPSGSTSICVSKGVSVPNLQADASVLGAANQLGALLKVISSQCDIELLKSEFVNFILLQYFYKNYRLVAVILDGFGYN